MPTWWTRKPRLIRCALALLVLLAVLCLVLGLSWRTVGHTLAHWTGEEDLWEQLKGTVALAYLRLAQGTPRTDPLVPIVHSGLSPYGVNTFLEQEADPAKVEETLRLVARAGFAYIRQEFPWEDIEIFGKGDFWDHKWNRDPWAKYDRIVDLADAYGLQVIARLDNPPAWSRAVGNAPGWSMAPPDDYEDFGDYVYAVVSRYRGRVRYYQIWNEPNIYPEWGDQPADPAGYVALLQVAYRRAKEADPDCVVIAAGLAQTTEETPPEFGPRNVSDLLYLEQMYQAGVQGHFDVMGAMVYGLWTGPYDRRTSTNRTNFSRVQLLRQIMVQHGDADKPIWATEVGWNALPENFMGAPLYGRVSEEQQAIYTVEAYQRAAREWPWMGVMNYWFFRRPSEGERDQAWYYFRMVEPDFSPLPVYQALARQTIQPPTMQIGYHQEDHWALEYSQGWQRLQDAGAVLGAYALGQEGASLDFTFEGTALNLVLTDQADAANLRVAIDGLAVHPRSAVQGSAAVVSLARHLADGPHQVHLQVQAGTVGLDGLIVQRVRPLWRTVLPVGLGLLALAALTWACFARPRKPCSA